MSGVRTPAIFRSLVQLVKEGRAFEGPARVERRFANIELLRSLGWSNPCPTSPERTRRSPLTLPLSPVAQGEGDRLVTQR